MPQMVMGRAERLEFRLGVWGWNGTTDVPIIEVRNWPLSVSLIL